ncbi:pyruvate formate lyase family protein [Chloroflexota bacterium]
MRQTLAEDVSTELLDAINRIELPERLRRMRERYFSEWPKADGERAKLAADSWKETVGQPLPVRRARLLQNILENISVTIFDDEMTVGSISKYLRGANPSLDYDSQMLAPVMEDKKTLTFGGPVETGLITDEDQKNCSECAETFKGQTGAEKVAEFGRSAFGSWYDDLLEAKGTLSIYGIPPLPCTPKWEIVFEKGLRGIIEEVRARINAIEGTEDDPEKFFFLQSVIISCEAVVTFAGRYAEAALEKASSEADPARKAELEKIAEICTQVPENPSRTFREALQTYRLLLVALFLEQTTFAPWTGRIDQFLCYYFRRDIAEGRLNVEEAAELVGDVFSFEARLQHVRTLDWRDFVQATLIRSYTIGGVDKDGEDACNEMTYLILHVAGLLRYAEPHISLRWSPNIPERFMMKAAETNCEVGGGIPQYQNDEHIIKYFTDRGWPIEHARNYAIEGCSHPVTDNVPSIVHPVYLNSALALDLALHNGIAPMTGKRIGIKTGDPRKFKTFDDVLDAWKKQQEYLTRRLCRYLRFGWRIVDQYWQAPLQASLLPKCLEEAKDIRGYGMGPYSIYFKDRNLVDTGDCLAAIKKLVFDDAKLTMEELLQAIDANFENGNGRGEEINKMCLDAPKYGNDIEEVDDLVRQIAKYSASIIFSEKNPFGEPFLIIRNGVSWHYHAGQGVGALPNGRKAGKPLYDGSASPMTGMDRNGPTAVVRSLLKADFVESISSIFNQRFTLGLFQSPENRKKLCIFTDTFNKHGGTHIQYNLLDRRMLLAAKKEPEKYRDLVVRVAGYSAYFVTLTPEVQDEIIARTEQRL